MFDSVSKFQIEHYPADFAAFLLGQPIQLTALAPTELSIEPIRADSLILMQSEELILQCEFQTDPDPKIPFRCADYRLRSYRKFPTKRMEQFVIYLRDTESPQVFIDTFQAGELHHRFKVIRIWEIPSEQLLQFPGLLPYAVLGKTNDPEGVLQQISTIIEELPRAEQGNLLAVSSVLAGLKLDKTIIQRLMRSEVMQESVIYQDILAQGEQRGREQGEQIGEQRGRAQEARSIATRQLTRKVGNLPIDLLDRLTNLSLEQVEALSDALLDFQELADLMNWLNLDSNLK